MDEAMAAGADILKNLKAQRESIQKSNEQVRLIISLPRPVSRGWGLVHSLTAGAFAVTKEQCKSR